MANHFDEGWRQGALRGEAGAIQELMGAVMQPLFSFCLYRVGRNQHLCEEVVQETMMRALRELDHYQPERASNNIFPWLTGLARNEIQRILGREQPGISLQALWARMDKELTAIYAKLESEPFGDDLLQKEETRELVNATMSQLPSHYREALEGKYVDGKSIRELAGTWHITEKAAESQLTRARNAFRAAFLALSRNLQVELV